MNKKNKNIVELLINDINETSNDLKYSAGVQLVYTALLLNKYLDYVLSRFNLNGPRVRVLFTLIVHNGRLKPKELTRLLFQSKQGITNIVESLLRSGLVSKQIDPEDRRSYSIVITRKGLDSARVCLPIIMERINRTMGFIPQEEIQSFKTSLKTIRKNLYRQLEDFAKGIDEPLPGKKKH